MLSMKNTSFFIPAGVRTKRRPHPSVPSPYSICIPFFAFRREWDYFVTFSKSEAGCLQIGQMKSSGSSSPTYSYPQIRHLQIV